MSRFRVGDIVRWIDPDRGLCSGTFTVCDTWDGGVSLKKYDGSFVEANESECRLVMRTERRWKESADVKG